MPRSPFSILRIRPLALAVWLTLGWATALGAADCIAVDENDQPRSCTLSERLGECGYEAWQSWKQCIDPDSDGQFDGAWWEQEYCNFFAAIDLMSCTVEVPWSLLKV